MNTSQNVKSLKLNFEAAGTFQQHVLPTNEHPLTSRKFVHSPAYCAAGGGRRSMGSGEDTGAGGHAGADVGAEQGGEQKD